MATEIQSYPIISANTWWTLRNKFNSTIPKEVTAGYLALVLNMSEDSAKTNVLSKLKLVGLIDEQNKPTDLAVKWRDDSEYKKVCDDLIKKIYPSELIEAIDDPINNKNRVTAWFKNKAKVGEQAAVKMTNFYLLLVKANFSEQTESSLNKSEKPKSINNSSVKKKKAKNDITNTTPQFEQELPAAVVPEVPQQSAFKPSIHIDVQIHISPDSSPEQIDKIFESMSKHLGGFKVQ